MAFESLSEKLQGVFKNLRSKGRLTEDDVKAAMREVKRALLEADVNFKVVKTFIKSVQERAVGQDVLNGLNPGQMVIKIVKEEMEALMGSTMTEIQLRPGNEITIILMAGLQGAGKTTTCAKLAGQYKKKGKRPLLVACDVYRPAAIKQLQVNGEKVGVPVFTMGDKQNPVDIAKASVEHAQKNGNNIVILDTAGRLHIDENMMTELVEIKENVDVLTLTATPIPRTMHMSLIGIRDMSLLEEAPVDRQPIQTYVMEYNDELIREAIMRELARGGQVYYVYNRVNGIDEIAAGLSELVPDASVAYAHGQMSERELEKIMYQFINGEIDVLVSTTIIETGLDISNVNTMIIHDADKLGLSQLYQLRGRVGRSNRTSYAFLMYKRDKMLKEVAEKRLSAIREFTELGSGYRIAMRDLEIRGAGNLLGERQSGHMEAVGYDLYCKMLNQAVMEAKGEKIQEDFETSVDIDIDAFIPSAYIKNEFQKLDMYKRIASIQNADEYGEMLDELIDRFGELPKPAANLLLVALIRAEAHAAGVVQLVHKEKETRIYMHERADVDVAAIPDFLAEYGRRIQFKATAKNPYFLVNMNGFKGQGLLLEEKSLVENMLRILCHKELN